MATRAAVYLRVSTSRQADHDLSIPDQRRQAQGYCEARGWTVVSEYEEPGASATTDRRPVFQEMIADATSSERPYEVIVVHSLSRFARNALDVGLYRHKLEKRGVRVISVTQDFSDDGDGRLLQNIIAAMDEHHSDENAKHTSRAMKENARLGFWNGSRPPYGYRTVEAERRRDKVKKRLEIEPKEAEIVRLAFRLYVYGDGTSGPMGLKTVVSHLNARGFTNRQGRPFNIQAMQQMLRRAAYIGKHFYNRTESRNRTLRKREEWIEVPVPPVVDEEIYDAAQHQLAARNPKKTPPRLVNNPVLLSGIAHCGNCGSRMRLRTGKGSRYRYYTCGRHADKGRTSCTGRTIPMKQLDDLVLGQLVERILEPSRLEELLGRLMSRADETREKHQREIRDLSRKLREDSTRYEALCEAVETQAIPVDGFLRRRFERIQKDREETHRLIAMKEQRLDASLQPVSAKHLQTFSQAVRNRLENGPPAFRKAYVGYLVDRVEVGDGEIRISGSTAHLAAQAAKGGRQSNPPVRSFEKGWRARQDSNLRPLASEASALIH